MLQECILQNKNKCKFFKCHGLDLQNYKVLFRVDHLSLLRVVDPKETRYVVRHFALSIKLHDVLFKA